MSLPFPLLQFAALNCNRYIQYTTLHGILPHHTVMHFYTLHHITPHYTTLQCTTLTTLHNSAVHCINLLQLAVRSGSDDFPAGFHREFEECPSHLFTVILLTPLYSNVTKLSLSPLYSNVSQQVKVKVNNIRLLMNGVICNSPKSHTHYNNMHYYKLFLGVRLSFLSNGLCFKPVVSFW